MKKALFLLFLLLLAPCLFACGGESQVPAYGTLFTTADPVKFADLYKQSLEGYEAAMDGEFVYYENLSSLLLALNADQIKVAVLPFEVSNFIAQRNEGLKALGFSTVPVRIQMGLRSEDTSLRDEFDVAIDAMSRDGTLDALLEQWVYRLPADEEPAVGALPVIPGAETVRVGVTGDLPPLDYISPDGRPSGYNVAVLSEISRRTAKNIELVSIDAAARVTALAGGRIDVIFWLLGGEKVNDDGSVTLYSEADEAEGVVTTHIYYEDTSSWLSKDQ